MLENPIFAIIFILSGTFQFYWISTWNDGPYGDINSFRGYISSCGFLTVGLLILLKISFLIAAITIMTCSIGVLTIGISSKRIGNNNLESKPQPLAFCILSFITSLILFFEAFIGDQV
jgi:hypothetical protein